MFVQLFALLLLSAALELAGHLFRLLRWEQFIRIYERPARRSLLRGMAGGYALSFALPFHLGDLFRAVYAGRRMKTGVGFGLATVIMDRFLDVWVVAVLFGVFLFACPDSSAWVQIAFAARYYLVFSLVLVAALVLVALPAVRDVLKRVCLAVCGIFNDTLKLDGMVFCWSLIHTFKDLRRIHVGRLAANTAAMWAAYLCSYAVLGRALLLAGGAAAPFGAVEVFSLLFGRRGVTVFAMGVDGTAPRALFAAWFLLPLALMWLVTLLPQRLRGALNLAIRPEADGARYLNLLPQVDPQDRAAFLSQYFGLQNKDYVDRFLAINENITILQDYSAGSNATTMLCVDKTETFYRKYAFGADGAKLAEQLDWLRAQQGRLPLCRILRQGTGEGYCWYDMAYSPQAVGMFRYLHSNPVEKSAVLLRSVLDTLEQTLYRPTAAPADPALVHRYIEQKVDANLQKLREARVLRELTGCDIV
ncbi:MAG: lysylphosphatidylglycerol synthase transmembrane domain-containing protein, partial [Gemmiger sp.]